MGGSWPLGQDDIWPDELSSAVVMLPCEMGQVADLQQPEIKYCEEWLHRVQGSLMYSFTVAQYLSKETLHLLFDTVRTFLCRFPLNPLKPRMRLGVLSAGAQQ